MAQKIKGLCPKGLEIGKCYVAKTPEHPDGLIELVFEVVNVNEETLTIEVVHVLDYDEYAPLIGERGSSSIENLIKEKVHFRELTATEQVLFGRKSV